MEAWPSPLSSRAKPRDLQFSGPFVEMFSTERPRISCHAALDRAACAALRKESRMKFFNATKPRSASGKHRCDDSHGTNPCCLGAQDSRTQTHRLPAP